MTPTETWELLGYELSRSWDTFKITWLEAEIHDGGYDCKHQAGTRGYSQEQPE